MPRIMAPMQFDIRVNEGLEIVEPESPTFIPKKIIHVGFDVRGIRL